MTNLIGYLLKSLFLFSVVLAPLLFPSASFAASNELIKKLSVEYDMGTNGDLNVTFTNTLTKSTTFPTVITNYSYIIPVAKYDKLLVSLNNKSVKYTATSISGGYRIYLTLSNTIVSKDSPLVIKTQITLNSFASFENENTHITLPTLDDSLLTSARLNLPNTAGNIIWSNFKYQKGTDGLYTLSDLGKRNLSMVVGSNIGHELEINKNIINDADVATVFKISLPREGDGQSVIYESITPTPYDVDIDIDKNTSFSYLIEAKSSITVNIKAYITRGGSANTIPSTFESYLSTDKYWAFANDTELKRLKLYLRSNGIDEKDIASMSDQEFTRLIDHLYIYVINRYSPVEDTGTTTLQFIRQGVANVENAAKNGAYTDDYTDLIVAILRYNKIPSRMVLGYISNLNNYNENGFFHSWAEYWDSKTGKWVVLDPALQDYYPAIYYGTDLDHISMVVRTNSSFKPESSVFSSDEFKIAVADSSISPLRSVQLDLNDFVHALTRYEGSVTIENNSNTIMLLDKIQLKNLGADVSPSNIINTKFILPGQSTTLKLSFDEVEKVSKPQILLIMKDLSDNTYKYPKTIDSTSILESDRLINLAISFIMFLLIAVSIRFVFIKIRNK